MSEQIGEKCPKCGATTFGWNPTAGYRSFKCGSLERDSYMSQSNVCRLNVQIATLESALKAATERADGAERERDEAVEAMQDALTLLSECSGFDSDEIAADEWRETSVAVAKLLCNAVTREEEIE